MDELEKMIDDLDITEIQEIEYETEEDRWNFTRIFMNTRRYPLHILQRLRTGTTLKDNGWLLNVKKILWNRNQ